MERLIGIYAFVGVFVGAMLGFAFGAPNGNGLLGAGFGALAGAGLGWFIAAAVIENRKQGKRS